VSEKSLPHHFAIGKDASELPLSRRNTSLQTNNHTVESGICARDCEVGSKRCKEPPSAGPDGDEDIGHESVTRLEQSVERLQAIVRKLRGADSERNSCQDAVNTRRRDHKACFANDEVESEPQREEKTSNLSELSLGQRVSEGTKFLFFVCILAVISILISWTSW
jgi:hypothetical protein